MPIEYVEGDIFEAKTQVVVNTVNCKGVMGKGLALQFKKKYPGMYRDYKLKCKEGKIKIGKPDLYKGTLGYWILNFPTKNDWRQKSQLEYIEDGLAYFKKKYKEWGITSIAFPKLGCQLGGLDWTQVRPKMEKYLSDLPGLKVEIYSHKTNEEKPGRKNKTEKKTKKDKKNPNQQSLIRFGITKKSDKGQSLR